MNMFDIFKNERNKHKDMTIKYREIQGINEIGYQNDNGIMVIKFNDSHLDNGAVLYYKESGNTKGLGEKVSEIEKLKDGNYKSIPNANTISKMPDEFKIIARHWNDDYSRIINAGKKKEQIEINIEN